MHYLHGLGFVHSDLSPRCVLLNRNDDVKISEFFYLREEGEEAEHYGSCLWYASPEMLVNGKITPSSDIYSLSCMVAEMILRKPLFAGQCVVE